MAKTVMKMSMLTEADQANNSDHSDHFDYFDQSCFCFSGRTTLVERGATQLGGETLVVEICKLLKGFPATHGLIGPVDITDNLPKYTF